MVVLATPTTAQGPVLGLLRQGVGSPAALGVQPGHPLAAAARFSLPRAWSQADD